MIPPILAALSMAAAAVPAVPDGRPAAFGRMSDAEIHAWLRWNHYYHAANVFRCRGLSYREAERRLERELGSDFAERTARLDAALKARHGESQGGGGDLLAIGYRIRPAYCRRIRHVVADMLRGASELERRLR